MPRFLVLLALLLHAWHVVAQARNALELPAGAAAAVVAAAAPLRRELKAASWNGGLAAGRDAAGPVKGGRGIQEAAAAAGPRQGLHLLAAANTSSSGGAAAAREVTAPRCRPTMRTVAWGQPGLSQLMGLVQAGYDVFQMEGSKPFTLLAPSNSALQNLAAGILDGDERQQLESGFYSVMLYHQLPDGAFNVSQLLNDTGSLLTSLGRALKKDRYSVTIDKTTQPVTFTGGWGSNNAQLLSSHEACDGWIHVLSEVLLPTRRLSELPRLVDNQPDLQSGSFWALLDGSGGGSPAEAPEPLSSPPPPPANTTSSTVCSGNGNSTEGGAGCSSSGGTAAAGPSSSGGGSDKVLVAAASAAGAAVALCALLVGGVLLRKHQLRRRRQQQARSRLQGGLDGRGQGEEEEEDEAGLDSSLGVSVSKASMRPVQVHVDA